MQVWKPDFQFNHYTDITPEWCDKHHIKFILSDLDGTLAGWNEGVDDTFIEWYKGIEKVGVGVVIVSNNNRTRVEPFADACKLVSYSNCQKPSTKKIKEELFDKGLRPEVTLFLGDQLFTDVWCGKKLGVRTALVPPLGEYEPKRTACKRWLEDIIKQTWRD